MKDIGNNNIFGRRKSLVGQQTAAQFSQCPLSSTECLMPQLDLTLSRVMGHRRNRATTAEKLEGISNGVDTDN